MKKRIHSKKYACYALLCIFLLMLFGCAQENQEQMKIRTFYQEFSELNLVDPALAIENYVHYEDETIKSIALASIEGDRTIDYEILKLDKISDTLWAVEVYVETTMQPDGFTAYNFVGEIDGTYKIMRGVNQIPQNLIQNHDLGAYIPTGDFVDPEDVIIDMPIQKED